MEELAGESGRWWHSVRQSHGDIHHSDVAHNVIVKSLCTKGFSYLEKWLIPHKEGLSKPQMKISSKKDR